MSDIGPSSPVKPAGTGDLPQVTTASGTSEQTEPQKPAAKSAPANSGETAPERAAPSPAVTLAATLARIPSGSELTGIIVGTDGDGLPVVRTPSATFILSKPLPIAVNSQITLQIQSVGNELRAALLTVNGQVQHPPPTVELSLASVPAQTGPQRPLVASLSPGPVQTGVPPAVLAPGSQVSALVVPAIGDSPTALAAPGTIQGVRLAPGTPLMLQVTSVTLPQGAAIVAQAFTTALGLEGAGATTSTSVPPPPSSSSPATTTPTLAQIVSQQPAPTAPGTGHERQVIAAPDQPTLSPTTSAATHTHIAGVVTGATPDGGLLVNTPNGMLALDTRAALLPGTHISFAALPAPTATGASQAGVAAETAAMALASQPISAVSEFAVGWPALREAIVLLQAIEPPIAQQILNNVVPGANSQMTAGVLLFMAALRGGDVRNWIGSEAVRVLEQLGRRDLLARLAGDFQQMSRVTDMPIVGDWRTLMFPFFDGHDLQQICAFYRELKREQEEKERSALRFVVELELSALGDLQLDGLVNERRFDLIVRSRADLKDTVRQDNVKIFEDSLGATGMTGTLTFSSGEAFPESPFREAWHEGVKGDVLA